MPSRPPAEAGLEVGAFFILCYPGDTDETVLQTLHFATRLPLDYLGLSMPYPLPGTDLYNRTREQITRQWRPDDSRFGGHVVIFEGGFSEAKMWFALLKGRASIRDPAPHRAARAASARPCREAWRRGLPPDALTAGRSALSLESLHRLADPPLQPDGVEFRLIDEADLVLFRPVFAAVHRAHALEQRRTGQRERHIEGD